MEMLGNLVKSLTYCEQLSQHQTTQGFILKISLIAILASREEIQTDKVIISLTTAMKVCIFLFDFCKEIFFRAAECTLRNLICLTEMIFGTAWMTKKPKRRFMHS